MAIGRAGRYPSKKDGGPSWWGTFMDTNSPETDNWYYDMETEQPEGWKFYIQSPGLLQTPDGYIPNPEAENIGNLPGEYDYYLNQLSGKTREWVAVYILNRFGSIHPGNYVYEDYEQCYQNGNWTKRTFDPGLPELIWTHDQNFTPLSSAVIQREKVGSEWHDYAIDEIVLHSAVAQNSALEFIERYKGYKGIVKIYGDVRGNVGAKHGHESDFQIIARLLQQNGFRVSLRVPTTNGAIKDGQNSLRARLCDALFKRRMFVNPAKCKTLDQGFSQLKYKVGSTYQEDETYYQHITTAMRYYTAVEYPLTHGKAAQGNWLYNK